MEDLAEVYGGEVDSYDFKIFNYMFKIISKAFIIQNSFSQGIQ
jgi:hypothetical protein